MKNKTYSLIVSSLFILCIFAVHGIYPEKQDAVKALELAATLSKVPRSAEFSDRQSAIAYHGAFPTITNWVAAFEKLPKNRQGARALIHSGFAACGDKANQWKEFSGVLDTWLTMQKESALSNKKNWSASNIKDGWFSYQYMPNDDFFDITITPKFAPFAQKLISNVGDIFYFHGDLHGDIFSLLEEIKELKRKGVVDNHFRIVKNNAWFVFLGDYVDRGQYGAEVLYTMMRLALANPGRVIAVRGNHEDIEISARYGFRDEIREKFNDVDGSKHIHISRMNDFLPVVFYLGCKDDNRVVNYVQCCHGGVEEEYDPKAFLDDQKTIYQLLGNFSSVNHSVDGPFDSGKTPLGFMWSDFDVDSADTDFHFIPYRGFKYGQKGTLRVLQTMQSSQMSKIRGILRAHQHTHDASDSMMKGILESKGVYKLWKPYEKEQTRHLGDGLVWTFNVGPDTVYGQGCNFNFDTYVELTTAKEYKDWVMKVFNTTLQF